MDSRENDKARTKKTQTHKKTDRLCGLLLGNLCLALLGELHLEALLTFHNPLVDEEVPHGVRHLGALLNPVSNAIGLEVHGRWLCEGVVRSEIFEIVPPWVFRFFGNNETVRRLFRLSHAAQTDSQHV